MTAPLPGVVTHALRALTDHIDTHLLSAPRTIHVEDTHLHLQAPSQGAEYWASTLADGDGIRCTHVDEYGYSHFETNGLLPASGVRIHLTWCRRTDVDHARLVLLTNPHAPARDAARKVLEQAGEVL